MSDSWVSADTWVPSAPWDAAPLVGGLVQSVQGSAASASGFTTTAVTTDVENVVVLVVGRSGGLATGALTGVTDQRGNTWQLITRGAVSGVNNTRVEAWYTTQNVGALTAQTISVTSAAAQSSDYMILEIEGVNKSSLINVASPDGSGVTSATPSTPVIVTTVDTMVWSIIHHAYNAAADTLTADPYSDFYSDIYGAAPTTAVTRSVFDTTHETAAAYGNVGPGAHIGAWARGGSVNSAAGTITFAFTEAGGALNQTAHRAETVDITTAGGTLGIAARDQTITIAASGVIVGSLLGSATQSVAVGITATGNLILRGTASVDSIITGTAVGVGGGLSAHAEPLQLRLRAYTPDGADLGLLPVPTTPNVTYPLNDVGGLTFDYSTRAPRVSLLGQPCEVAVELSDDGGNTWAEKANSRFVYLTDGADPLGRPDSYRVECKSYVWRLSKAIVLPNGLLNADGKRAFLLSNGANPGVVLKTLLNEASVRGWAPGITHSTFNTVTDSAGQPWAKGLTIYYTPGLDYLTILRNLADEGYIDFCMEGRQLKVYNPETTLATDRTMVGVPVVFRAGRDLTEAPFRRTWEGLANFGYLAGEAVDSSYTNPLAITPWGRQELFVSNGSVSDTGTMQTLLQAELSQTDAARTEYTRGLNFSRAPSYPLFEYAPGDYVWSSVDGAIPEKLRVFQITLTADQTGVLGGNVVLNDRFIESDIRQARRITGITNGASGDNTPGTGTVGGAELIPPGQVSGLMGSSLAYDGPGGFPQAQVTLTWNTVTINSDGTPITDLDHYEIWHRQSGEDIIERMLIATTTNTTHDLSPYPTGSTWVFSVRAVDSDGNRGNFAVDVAVGMASDTIPPQAPSAPTAVAKLGIISVSWDGLPATGLLPADFSHVEVHVSEINDFTPDATTLFEQMYGQGTVPYTAGLYGIPYFFKLIAVDKSDLKSPASAQGTATPARLVGSDLSEDAITYEQLGFKDPGNVIRDGSFESANYRTTLAAQSATAWTFTTLDKFHGDWAATIDAAVDPSTTRDLGLMVTADAQQILATDKLFCRFAYKGTAGATGVLQLVVEWTDSVGITTVSTLDGTVKNGTWQQAAAQLTAPADTETFRVYVKLTNTGTTGVYHVDAVEVRRTIGTSIIQDAAITNALIANLAVNSAKISSLDVGKLTTGSLTADVLVAGKIQTASAGNRVELTGTGLRLWAGTSLKAHMDPVTGQLKIFNTGDATHTSTAHGLQLGASNAQNIIIDDNEIMSRFNGTYGSLLLNREGGRVRIGGKIGGFNPDQSDLGVFPQDDDHMLEIIAGVYIENAATGDYADENAPLMVGLRGFHHLWMDEDEIGCANGDVPTTLHIMPPLNSGANHNVSIAVASDHLFIERLGTDNAGIRGTAGIDSAIQLFSGSVRARSNGYLAYRDMLASAFTVSSEGRFKQQVQPVDAISIIKDAPGRQWKYIPEVDGGEHWHYGPMAENLPAEMLRTFRDGKPEDVEGPEDEDKLAVDIAALAGITWEGLRQLVERVEALEGRS